MDYLILATDHSSFVDAGNVNIILSLNEMIEIFRTKTYIVYPEQLQVSLVSNSYKSVREIDVSFISGEVLDADPYFLQLSITKVFNLMSDHEKALYLDYDHVIVDPAFIVNLNPKNGLIVSSEIVASPNLDLLNMEYHFNSSLICGCGRQVKQLSKYWRQCYFDVINKVGFRNRTEIALTKAIFESGLRGIPCSDSIQSNFSNWASKYQIFHFGGSTQLSHRMKCILNKYSQAENLTTASIEAMSLLNGQLKSELDSWNA
jgi:hypothetical protein